jgi:hypothetical protein
MLVLEQFFDKLAVALSELLNVQAKLLDFLLL